MTLSSEDLPRLEELGVKIPKFDRSQITPGVVHIGPSNFFRAQAMSYFDDINEHDPRWGVRAISLKETKKIKTFRDLATEFVHQTILPAFRFQKPALPSLYEPTRKEILEPQEYLYTVNSQGNDGIKQRVIGSLIDITIAPEQPEEAMGVICDPRIKLVTLTVTQNGYSNDTIDFLIKAIEGRMHEKAPPLTIMSCDNMPENGILLQNAVVTKATEKSKELRAYIEQNITFPSTMVDRITPKTTQKDVFNSAAQGIHDGWPIMTEEFCQWAVENKFAGEMPDLESVGVIITNDVMPYEFMKLRMLNGAHMALGCVAGLAGYTYVDEAMQDEQIKTFIEGYMDEAMNTVPAIEGVDFDEYKALLIKRLENPHMKDELVRLARNGITKIKGRLLDALIDARGNNLPYQHIAFATAAWIQYLKGSDVNGNAININDEKAIEMGLQQIAQNSNGNPIPVMERSELFEQLITKEDFVKEVTKHLHNIQQHGIQGAISRINVPQIQTSVQPKSAVN